MNASANPSHNVQKEQPCPIGIKTTLSPPYSHSSSSSPALASVVVAVLSASSADMLGKHGAQHEEKPPTATLIESLPVKVLGGCSLRMAKIRDYRNYRSTPQLISKQRRHVNPEDELPPLVSKLDDLQEPQRPLLCRRSSVRSWESSKESCYANIHH